MRKATLGLCVLVGLGLAGTASADHLHHADCDHDDDGYGYDDDDDGYDDDYDRDDFDDAAWISATVELPSIRPIVVEPRAGYVWVEGHWTWTGYEWSWQDGYWMRSRPDHVYAQGRWVSSGHRHRWVPGRWNRAPRVIIRHDNRRNDHRGWGRGHGGRIEVRDHRTGRSHARGNRGRGHGWGRGGRR